MASERQIAANRRNAKLSTGPTTAEGKRRSRANALRHGLAATALGAQVSQIKVDELAKEIARECNCPGDSILGLAEARMMAEAILVLDRIGQVKKTLINTAIVAGERDQRADKKISFRLRCMGRAMASRDLLEPILEWDEVRSAGEDMVQETQRTAKAVERAIPHLQSLERYERRVAARRDRALKALIKRVLSSRGRMATS